MPRRASARRNQRPLKHLNVELVDETWARFYRISKRLALEHGWTSCNQQKTVQLLIELSPLGDVYSPDPPPDMDVVDAEFLEVEEEVPLPPPRRKGSSRSRESARTFAAAS